MTIGFFVVWYGLGDAFNSKRNFAKMTWNFHGQEIKRALRATPLCLFLTLWKGRNRQAFEDSELSEQAIKLSLISTFLE